MDLGLQGKVAIVTGGSDGLGLATAGRLAAEGAAVAICGRDETRLKDAADKLRARGAVVLDVPADVTRAGDLERLVSQTLERFGRIVSSRASSPPRPGTSPGPGSPSTSTAVSPGWCR
jgi:3-oxoacyl-[acyl-carrier protein] reductase